MSFNNPQTVRRWWPALALAVAGALAGCASSVSLDDVPVEDRRGAPVTQQAVTPPATPASAAQNTVKPVDLVKEQPATGGPTATAKTIYFDFDSFEIRAEFQPVLDAHARYLVANRASRVTIEGHTDERGGREYNIALGQKRAEAVRRALGLLGVSDAQVEPVSFGKEKPAATGNSDDAMAKNRRAEFSYR